MLERGTMLNMRADHRDLSQESKSALMSDLPSIVTAEPNFRIRLTESWPLGIATAEIL